MGILSNISGKEAVRVFQKIGYYLDRQEGSHMILYNDNPGYPPLTIPNHKELAPGLLSAQIKRTKLTVEEFHQLRKKKRGPQARLFVMAAFSFPLTVFGTEYRTKGFER